MKACIKKTATLLPAFLGTMTFSSAFASPVDRQNQPTTSQSATQEISQQRLESKGATETKLGAPEFEIQRALVEINNVQRGLNTLRSLAASQSIGPQNMNAERSYKAAQRYFRADEPLSVIREINSYLNQTQVTDTVQYLDSLYMLGHAYLRIDMEQRAVRAFRRYISAFIRSPQQDDDTFLEVLKAMLPVAAKHTAQTNQELDKLLAAVTSINFEQHEDGALLYLAAQTAAQRGNPKIASKWFERASYQSSDAAVIARAWYYKALIALAETNFEAAKSYLGRVLELSDIDPDMRDLTHQAMARTSIHLRKPFLAIEHYNAIEESAPFYRDVLFELTYVYLEANEDEKAGSTARRLIQRYPQSNEAINLNSILAYIELKSGNLEKAGAAIAEARQQLQKIDSWLLTHLQNRRFLPFAVLNELITKTELDLRRSPITNDSQEIFQRIDKTLATLADIRGEIRDTLYTIGRAQVVHFRPVWENRVKQMDLLTRDLLTAGHRLSATEALVHEQRLSKLDKQKLEASSSRRQNIFSQQAIFRRQVSMWSAWININRLSNDVSRLIVKLHDTNAELNALGYLTNNPTSQNAQRREEIDRLLLRRANLQEHLHRSLEIIRKKQVLNLATRSQHAAIRSGFIQFANSLYEEASIMQPYRDQASDHALRAISIDANRAWKRWEYVAKVAFETIEGFHNEMVSELKETISLIQDLTNRHDELVRRTTELNEALESHLGESIYTLVTHYRSEIDQRLSNYQKWQAELEWLRFQQSQTRASKDFEQIQLQQQILRDNLDDIIQGIAQ